MIEYVFKACRSFPGTLVIISVVWSCCLLLIWGFPFSPLPTWSGFGLLQSGGKVLVRVTRNLHVAKSDRHFFVLLLNLPQQVLTILSFLSLWTTHCHGFPFTSRTSPSWSSSLGSPFSPGPMLWRGPGCLRTLFFVFTFSLHHLIQYHPNADVS